MQAGEVVELFENLDSLEIELYRPENQSQIELYTAASQAAVEAAVRFQSKIKQLMTLTGLRSLTVERDWECFPNLAQVLRRRRHRSIMKVTDHDGSHNKPSSY